MHIELKELVDLGLTNLSRPFIHDDIRSRAMTHLLTTFKYVYPFSDWAQQFDKLKRALICAALLWWMYSIWCQLFHVHYLNFIKSWSSIFDKLLCALTSFDLSSSGAFDMEWLMLHMPLFERISGGYSLCVILH